jgi:hypothetical protein
MQVLVQHWFGAAHRSRARYTGRRGLVKLGLSCANSNMGVWRSGSAYRLQRQTGAYISSSGDQQEWPFVQVRVESSLSSK